MRDFVWSFFLNEWRESLFRCGTDYLVANDNQLCQLAFDRGSLSKLAALVKSITPTEKASEWDEDEAESVSCLREVRNHPCPRCSLTYK